MRFLSVLSALLAVAAARLPPVKVDYNGATVIRLSVADKVDLVQGLVDRLSLKTWGGSIAQDQTVDIVLLPANIEEFKRETAGLQFEVMHGDLGVSIREEGDYRQYSVSDIKDGSWFQSYHSFDDHLRFLRELQALYPKNAEIVNIGLSEQGQQISGLHIYSNKGVKKPAVVIHGTTHAREWITTMVTEYLAHSLLTGCKSDKDVKQALNKYDFYFIPVVNPDGFLYTKNGDRLWRKNREINDATECLGIDLNRNWNAFWDFPKGASTDPCSNLYKGPAPNAAAEIEAHSNFLLDLANNKGGLKLYIDIHSYLQEIWFPYGHTCDIKAPTDADLRSLAEGTADAISAVKGTEFKAGSTCELIKNLSGGSSDFAYHVAKAPYAYTIELENDGKGFVVPPDQILASCKNMLAGFRYMLANMKD